MKTGFDRCIRLVFIGELFFVRNMVGVGEIGVSKAVFVFERFLG